MTSDHSQPTMRGSVAQPLISADNDGQRATALNISRQWRQCGTALTVSRQWQTVCRSPYCQLTMTGSVPQPLLSADNNGSVAQPLISADNDGSVAQPLLSADNDWQCAAALIVSWQWRAVCHSPYCQPTMTDSVAQPLLSADNDGSVAQLLQLPPTSGDFDCPTSPCLRYQELVQQRTIDYSLLLDHVSGTTHLSIYVILNSLSWCSAGCCKTHLTTAPSDC